jgi:hypothetical protein
MAYEITLITTMAISILFALSLNFITGFCGQISLGHAAFMGVGAYTSAVMIKAGCPFLLTIPFAGTFAGLLGVLVGFASLRWIGPATGISWWRNWDFGHSRVTLWPHWIYVYLFGPGCRICYVLPCGKTILDGLCLCFHR